MTEFEERVAAFVAQDDQVRAALTLSARWVGHYRQQLICQGFSTEEAFQLASAYHEQMLASEFAIAEEPSGDE